MTKQEINEVVLFKTLEGTMFQIGELIDGYGKFRWEPTPIFTREKIFLHIREDFYE